jgi:hypothetical protein
MSASTAATVRAACRRLVSLSTARTGTSASGCTGPNWTSAQFGQYHSCNGHAASGKGASTVGKSSEPGCPPRSTTRYARTPHILDR